MINKSKPEFTVGLVLGVFYIIGALFEIPLELILLLVVPFLCGFLAVYLSGKKSSSAIGFGNGAKLGALTGFTGSVIVIIAAPLLYLIASAILNAPSKEQLQSVGIDLPLFEFSQLLIALIIESMIGIAVAAVGGLIAVPIFGRR